MGLLIVVTAWSLFAFAGAYRWTLAPIVMSAALLVALVRPRPWAFPHTVVDTSLTACLLAVGLQLLPWPAWLHHLLSPSALAVEDALSLVPVERTSRVLSLAPVSTAWALVTGIALVLLHWTARGIFERRGGLRVVVRSIAWMGLVLGPVSFLAHWTTPRLIYGFWAPFTQSDSPAPYGPFVNRNHFATWLLLAVPLVVGYVMTRVASRRVANHPASAAATVDERLAMLVGSAVLMTAALLASLSRSGVAGLVAGLMMFGALGARRLARSGRAWLLLALSALLVGSAAYAGVTGLLGRLDATPTGLADRWTIWRDVWSMAGDFPATGLGVGAFERGMLVYQQGTRDLFFNHAHNQYLQLLVEGGLMLAVPGVVVVAAAVRGIASRLRGDRTAMFWLRLGAASGLAGVAFQSVWEVGLVMPANAVLLALVAAVALHAPGEPRGECVAK